MRAGSLEDIRRKEGPEIGPYDIQRMQVTRGCLFPGSAGSAVHPVQTTLNP